MLKFTKLASLFFWVAMLFISNKADAQTWIVDMCSGGPPSATTGVSYGPMYSSSTAGSTSRMAVIYPSTQLNTIAGTYISNVYFHKAATTTAMLGTPNFKIYMKEVSAADWGAADLVWSTAIQGATLVYDGNPVTAVGTAAGWKNFALSTNFPYTGGQNLAIFMEYQNATASTTVNWSYEYTGSCVNTANNNTSKIINTTTGTLGANLNTSNYRRPYIAFDYMTPTCAGTPLVPVASSSVAAPCPSTPFTLSATNLSIGTGITYNWQYYNTVTSTWVATGATTPAYTVTAGITVSRQYRVVTTCAQSGATSTSNTVTVNVSSGLAGGTYTINNTLPTAGTNYHSFTEAIAAMNCGILGPVVFNVTPGTPYVETINLGAISGTSATNTIKFNGNGATVQYTNTASAPQLLTFSGTKYVKVDSINFKSLATDYGWAANIMNGSSFDSITRCKFDLSSITSVSSIACNGITFSGSVTSPTTSGLNGTRCYIGNNYILGPVGAGGMYYGFTIMSGGNDSNVIAKNTLENFYYYGFYLSGPVTGTKILNNDLHKTSKTGSITSFFGVYLSGDLAGTQITGNRFHNPQAASGTSTSGFYGIYTFGYGLSNNPIVISNNLIYNVNMGGTMYCMYLGGITNTNIYHNTINIDKAFTSTSTNYGIYSSSTNTGTNIKNNVISITAGGTGSKYGFYYSSASGFTDLQKNNVYVNSTQSGSQYYGYLGTAYATIAAFQTAQPLWEIGSISANPQFVAPATGNLTPGNQALYGTGANVMAVVPVDINNTLRSPLPTPGAYELPSTSTNDAGAFAIASPTGTVCAGTQQLSVKIMNAGQNVINTVQVYWSLNGTVQTPVTYSTPINILTNPAGNIATVVLGNVNFTTTPINIKVWTYQPNGGADTVHNNDTLTTTVAASLSGTFTINSAVPTGGTNYQTFTEFANDLAAYGVCAPVTANVVAGSGPYVEFVKFANIPGTSAVNKVKINGNGATVQFNNTATNRQLLTLDAVKYLSIDSLNFKALNATYGWAALITNGAAFDTIKRCTFDLTGVTGSSSIYTNGITFSGSNSSPTTSGSTGTDCYIGYNKLLGPTGSGGPYYAFTMMGTQSNNVIDHNLFKNFYYYGMYIGAGTNLTIKNNEITRFDKTSVTTFYGMYIYGTLPGFKLINNRIHDPADPSIATTASGTFYGIYTSSPTATAASRGLIANNAVYGINLNGSSVYGLYLSYPSYFDAIHNTIVVDKPLTGSGTIYGLYASGTNNNSSAKNNLVSITAGTLGTKYGSYFASATSLSEISRNNVYVNSNQTGTQYYSYLNSNFNDIITFQAANPTFEVGSVSVEPQFANAAAGNFIPGNYVLYGNGANTTALVPTDILGVTRVATPTPGAFELPPTGTNNAGSVNMITPKGSFCAGLQPVNVSVVNAGTNNITSLKINWSINGVTQPVYNFNTTLSSITNTGQFLDTVLLGNANFPSGVPTTIRIWTSLPNNSADAYNANDTIQYTLQPSVFTINSIKDTLCPNVSTLINLTPALGYSTGNINWQQSTNGVSWLDIPTSDVVTYNTGTLTGDKYFRAKINGGVNACYSDSVKILLVNPQLLAYADSARCGPGTVVLNAAVSTNSLVKWYSSPTATTPIGYGSPWTTPYLGVTDTFYVSAGIGSSPSTCETPLVPVIVKVYPVPQTDLGPDLNYCVDEGYLGVLNAGLYPYGPVYLWDNGSTSQVRNYVGSNSYWVKVTNQYGCFKSDTINVTLRPNPVVELGNDTSICIASTLKLDAGDDGISYFWNTGQTAQSITINNAGQYNVFVTNSAGCMVADTIQVNMSGEMPSVQGISITNNAQYTFTFHAINAQNVIGYDWDFGDTTTHSNLESPTHTYAHDGNYIVVLKLASTCGFFTDTMSAHIVGIRQINVAANDLIVYPNPTREIATIQNKSGYAMKTIAVYNIAGQVVYKAQADSKDKHTLELNTLAPGMYTIEIFTDEGNIARKLNIVR